MLISLEILKRYIDIEEHINTILDDLTMLGHCIEAVNDKSKLLDSKIVIGEIVSFEKHPNADKLSVCKVFVATEMLDIVCGANNFKAGDKVVVATVGSVLPGDFEIKQAKLRGVESNGMLCSESELGLSKESDGIMILEESAILGMPIGQHLFGNDIVLDIEITPNRGDCLSYLGIARELSAKYSKSVKYPMLDLKEVEGNISSMLEVDIAEKELCSRYTARVLNDVKVTKSPDWLKKALEASNIKSINNIVDIGNFVMIELGHPIHIFDYDKLNDNKIKVRKAKSGESLVCLDKVDRKLDDKTLVIADSEKPLAIAGIIGGESCTVDGNTKNILIEVANFDSDNIRLSCRRLNVTSEAAYRFERGIDIEDNLKVVDRVASLIQNMTKESVVNDVLDQNYQKPINQSIVIDHDELNSYLGTDISKDGVATILSALNLFNQSKDNKYYLNIPSYRINDLKREADIYEEVARVYGYDKIEPKRSIRALECPKGDYSLSKVEEVKGLLVNLGLNEVINYSFIPKPAAQFFDNPSEIIEIINPINEDMSVLRPGLFYSLLQNLKYNFNNEINDIKIFEISRVFAKKEEGYAERYKVGIALGGSKEKSLWANATEYDFYYLKGYVERILEFLSIRDWSLKTAKNKNFDFAHSAEIYVGDKCIGIMGEVSAKIASKLGIKKKTFMAEMDLASLLEFSKADMAFSYCKFSKYPSITRDLALILDANTEVGPIMKEIAAVSDIVKDIELFDVYRGEQLGNGLKSVAFNIVFKSEDRTLQSEEVQLVMDRILKLMQQKYNAKLRDF